MSKFCYEEGELQFVECQCELCIYYNSGAQSTECPTELLGKIKTNEILCPNIKEPTVYDLEI